MLKNLPDWLENPDPHSLYEGKYVVVDFETTNIEKGSALVDSNRMVLSCWYTSWEDKLYYSWGGELRQQKLLAHLEEADFIIAHNAKFECQWLTRCGFDTASKPYWCTFNAEWVLAGNRPWRLNLDATLARRNMGGKASTVAHMMHAGVCPSEMPKNLLLSYGLTDVKKTAELFLRQKGEMRGTRLVPIVFTRSITSPVLADIEANGMYLDAERVEKEYDRLIREYAEISEEMNRITGGINPRSPKQVREFIYGDLGFKELVGRDGESIRTDTGLAKTDEATLLRLNATTDNQREFIEMKSRFAKVSSALDKNMALFVGLVREQEGLLYAQLNQGRAATHRLTSSGRKVFFDMFGDDKGCQFQNLPRVYKPMFRAREKGRLVGEVDGSQLEYRVAGHLGRDATITQEILTGYDVHSFTASVINKVPEDEVTKSMRTDAKADTFKPLFGGQSGTVDQKRYYAAFREKLSDLTDTQDRWCNDVANHKVLETEWGMLFYWPNAKRYGKDGYLNVKTSVYNYPIQSLATAEIVPIAMVHMWHRTRGSDILYINTVHDSVITEFPEESAELFLDAGVQCFTDDVYTYLQKVYDIDFTVPLGVGIKMGENWSESAYTDEELGLMVSKHDFCKHKNVTIKGGEISAEYIEV